MNAKNYSTEKPIVLVVDRSWPQDVIDDILNLRCSLQMIRKTLCLSIDEEAIAVPSQCHDALHLLLHHLKVYQLTATRLLERKNTIPQLQTYVAVTYYYCEVLLAFVQEVKVDDPVSNKTWRSAHLDYHFALALENSAFNVIMQKTALAKIKRSWGDFKEKKVYEPVQQLDIAKYHNLMCNDKNMCGNISATHRMSVEEMISEILPTSTSRTPTVVEGDTAETDVRQNRVTAKPQKTNKRTSVRNVKTSVASLEFATCSTTTSHVEDDNIEETANIVEMKDNSPNKRKSFKRGRQSKEPDGRDLQDSTAESKGHANRPGRKVTAKGKGKVYIDLESEDEGETAAQADSSSQDVRAPTRASKTSDRKGKMKAIVESDDEATAEVSVRAPSEGELDIMTPMQSDQSMLEVKRDDIGEDVSCYPDHDLPSTLEDWENWNRIALRKGHSHIFLKLGTWILLRFRQLAKIPIDDDVDGLLIPDHPANYEMQDDADFHEALGMTRLYSAIAHIDTHPQYLAHIFHELGKASNEERLASSHPRFRPLPELPTPVKSMMFSHDSPFLDGWPFEDADVDGYGDNDDGGVAGALNEMIISSEQNPAPLVTPDEQDPQKRKRTMSSTTSPPKKDGGRGFSKRVKGKPEQLFIRPSAPSATPIAEVAMASSTDIGTAMNELSPIVNVDAPSSISSNSHPTASRDMDAVSNSTPLPQVTEDVPDHDRMNEQSDINSRSLSQKVNDIHVSSASQVNDAALHIADPAKDGSVSDIEVSDGMTAPRNYDLTVGLLGKEVPSNSPIIQWKDGHRTILPAVYDDDKNNLCDAVDIQIIKYLAHSPVSAPDSQYVTHLSHNDITENDIQDIVGDSLSQNKPVVIRGIGYNPVGEALTAEYLDKYYAISPNRIVWIHDVRARAMDHTKVTTAGVLKAFFEDMKNPEKIQCVLDIPLAQAALPETLRNLDHGLAHGWNQTTYDVPISSNIHPENFTVKGWALLHHAGFLTYPHHDAEGSLTWVRIEVGVKFWVVFRPKDRQNDRKHLQDFALRLGNFTENEAWIRANCDAEVITLLPGDILIIPPRAEISRYLDVVVGDCLTNQDLHNALETLRRMMIAIPRLSPRIPLFRRSLLALCIMVTQGKEYRAKGGSASSIVDTETAAISIEIARAISTHLGVTIRKSTPMLLYQGDQFAKGELVFKKGLEKVLIPFTAL
ncbi:hypothetical protein DFJ58DRAFT_737581 [Suillus subalutaceus]|uniref:uncharacterized protein n=1 Tax=Suillus subalutaceus TaxID=48586 RepID=UPI001B862A14|nr:uncharacterized protein DFJ58DRAFT_737581 [Suillus subalutaceus]KAG1828889.1 hypothetical protein DFJ58DRAFT_737581 [Suillus subalutaceus]